MIMIQDDPMPTGADKPLRITGDPHKVQVGLRKAQCVPPSFHFTLNFTLFTPSVFQSNFKISEEFQLCLLLTAAFFLLKYLDHKHFDVFFTASP